MLKDVLESILRRTGLEIRRRAAVTKRQLLNCFRFCTFTASHPYFLKRAGGILDQASCCSVIFGSNGGID